MFTSIYLFELRNTLWRIAQYVFMAIIGLMAYMDASNIVPTRTMITAHGQVVHNAPITITRSLAFFSVLGILFSIVLAGRNVVRDFDERIHEFFFSAPISKFGYLGGRFFGGYTVTVLIYVGAVAGIILGCAAIPDQFVGPYRVWPFVQAFLYFVIPNLLLMGILFFTCASLTRNMLSTYVLAIAFMVIYFTVGSSLNTEENRALLAWLDPFGFAALEQVTLFWSVAERNTQLLPLDGIILWNRLLVLILSGVIFGFLYIRFKFIHQKEGRKRRFGFSTAEPESKAIKKLKPLPQRTQRFSPGSNIRQCLAMVSVEARRLLLHPAFLILTFLGARQAYHNFVTNAGPHGSNVYPLTSWFLRWATDLFGYMIPITVFFAGVLVWRERDHNSDEFFDPLPVPDWVPFASRLLTLMSVQFAFVLATVLTGIFAQGVIFGYTNFQLDVYAKAFFGIELLNYWHLGIIALLIQTLVPNKYLGYFICAGYFILDFFLYESFELTNFMMRFGLVPDYTYSNLNGFGHFAEPILWYRLYWGVLAVALLVIASLLWRRGKEINLRFRLRVARQRLTPRHVLALTSSTGAFLLVGGFIYYNSFVLNPYITGDDTVEHRAEYETKYGKFADRAQPEIKHISVNIDLYPEKRDVYLKGSYLLENKTDVAVDSVHVNLVHDRINRINNISLSRGAKVVHENQALGVRIFELETPLAPGDTTRLHFDYAAITRGFTENDRNNEVVANGTYIDNFPFQPEYYFPSIGFNPFKTVRDDQLRRQHGLPQKPDLPALEDSLARKHTFGGWVTFDATFSTSADQIAIATGDLVDSWEKDGRRVYRYASDVPLNNALVFLSGRYEILRDRHRDIDIEIYYHKEHAYNIHRMINGIKKSFDYCIANFGAYPYNTIKIVEVPSYGNIAGTARSQPTVFTWNENGGFISNLERPDAKDIVFSTTTHEMAHQWWGHIVQPASVEGLGVMTETLAQLVRIMCLQREFGTEHAREFIADEMEDYLFWRGRQVKEEVPLLRATTQSFLNYSKGSVAFYTLQEYLGEDRVNLALRRLVDRFAFEDSVYATIADLLQELRAVTPDSLTYMLTDLFETITLYENKALEATTTQLPDGRYRVKLKAQVKKLRSDGKGNTTPIEPHDLVEIGIFDEDGETLYMNKHWVTDTEQLFEIIVAEKPAQAGVDPHVILIDRDPKDNMAFIGIND